jgi:hypothetical protein
MKRRVILTVITILRGKASLGVAAITKAKQI